MAYWPSSCETFVSTGLTLCIVHMILINETGALCDTGVLFRFTFRSKYRDPMRIMAFFLFLALRYAIIKGALYRIWCGVNRLGDSGVKVV